MSATPTTPAATPAVKNVTLSIDDKPVTVAEGTTIWEAAAKTGVMIPQLCHQSTSIPGKFVDLNPVGVCRVCVVEVTPAGRPGPERVLAASCVRQCAEGMKVKTKTDGVVRAQRTLVELLMADHPKPCAREQETHDCELESLGRQLKARQDIFTPRAYSKGTDFSNPSIAIDHGACILCDRCVRACSDVKENYVIGRMGKGYTTSISFDDNQPMGDSSCVNCGECMISCPTGAITYSGHKLFTGTDGQDLRKTQLTRGASLEVSELQEHPLFKGISGNFLKRSEGSVVLRQFNKGEIICRQGDFGSTAFYIDRGSVEVYIDTPMSHVKTVRSDGLFKRMVSVLAPRGDDRQKEQEDKQYIPIDAPVDLEYGADKVATLNEGDLFGEMTCMNFYPRSATVRAASDGTIVLEMLRNVLDILQRNREFRKRIEDTYRRRALENHLRSTKLFKTLTPDFLEELRERVELVRFRAGQVICRQGETADAFYLVRAGHVKVSQSYPGGDIVRNYLARSSYFGEMGLLGGGVRVATCTALDHVDLVRIGKADFDRMLEMFPAVRAELETVAGDRRRENQRQARELQSADIDKFLSQGLMEATNLLILDLERCVRCDECVRACGAAHDGITRLVRDGLRFDKYLVATACRQCRDPLCMVGCPVGSIRRTSDLLNIVIEDWCIGCGLCAENCPYGNINMHEFEVKVKNTATGRLERITRRKATACDLCMEHKEPSCVYACPHDAAHRVEPQTFFDVHLKGRDVKPVQGTF